MGKNGNQFPNKAAKEFSDRQRVETMSEDKVYRLLGDDMDIILKQLHDNMTHVNGAKYPTYVNNIFANISSVKYIMKYVEKFRKVMTEEEKLAARLLIASGFKDSNQFEALDREDRDKMLRKAFLPLAKKQLKNLKILKLSRDKNIEIAMYASIEPKYGVRMVSRWINESTVSDKKKYWVFKRLYEMNFPDAVGALFTVDDKNNFSLFIYEKFMKMKKSMRRDVLREYATCFKKTKKFSFNIKNDAFLEKNKRIIKELIKEDRGFRKSFRCLKKRKPQGYKNDGQKNKKEFSIKDVLSK